MSVLKELQAILMESVALVCLKAKRNAPRITIAKIITLAFMAIASILAKMCHVDLTLIANLTNTLLGAVVLLDSPKGGTTNAFHVSSVQIQR